MPKPDRSNVSASGIREAIENGLYLHRVRNSPPYDGVLGAPPKWLPRPLADEFYQMRDRLLVRGHGNEEILRWMRAYAVDSAGYPMEYARELEGLLYVRDIVGIGKRRGCAAYAGTSKTLVRRAYRWPARSETEVIAGHKHETQRARGQRRSDLLGAKNRKRDVAIRKEAERLASAGMASRNIASKLAARIQRGEIKLSNGEVIKRPTDVKGIRKILALYA